MYKTDSADVKKNTGRAFLLSSIDFCATFETKLIKRPADRWIKEAIIHEIKKKNILSHEYKSWWMMMPSAEGTRIQKTETDRS